MKGSKVKIRLEKIGKTFEKKGESPILALDDVSFEVREGEFLSVLGPSGCGKTTLLNLVAGLDLPTKGAVYMGMEKITGPDPDRGLLFQEFALFPWKTVQENIEFGPNARGLLDDRRRKMIRKLVDLVGLRGFENKYPHELSGGMKQRCALARLLANDPKVLLMDEPLASVDAQTRLTLQNELLRVWGQEKSPDERKTVMYVTHSIEESIFLSDRVVVLTFRPAKVKRILTINLPRPRTDEMRVSEEFLNYHDEIWKLIVKELKSI